VTVCGRCLDNVFSLTEPTAFQRVHQAAGGIRNGSSLGTVLPEVLDGALSLTRADFGNVQILDPITGSLRIVSQSGFDSRFIDYFATVDDTFRVRASRLTTRPDSHRRCRGNPAQDRISAATAELDGKSVLSELSFLRRVRTTNAAD
jgi:hypothetical protein